MALSGNNFGVDFNPVSDRLQVVSDADQNLIVDPATGMATAGPAVTYGGMSNPQIVALASSGTLYGIDATTSYLVVIDPATGMITNRGPLGVSPGPVVGFDIVDGTGYFGAGPFFHLVNLATGNAPSAGTFPSPLFVRGLAAVPATGGGPGPGPGPGGEPVGGDFDLDGDVDAADLLLFRRNFNVGPNGVDLTVQSPDGLGAADAFDFQQWRANFGQSARIGSARASQRRRAVVLVKARRRVTLGAGERKRVRLPLTKAGKRFIRSYKKKRLKVTLQFTARYRPAAGTAQRRTFKRKVTLRVKRRQR
jgi:hypothetical protein